MQLLRDSSVSISPRKRPNSVFSKGFTLLELLIVIVIIGLLAGIVVPRYFEQIDKSKVQVARAQMDALEKSLEHYRLDTGKLPTQQQGLVALNAQPAGVNKWQGPYLKKGVPLDPWGNPYQYLLNANGKDFDIVSYGSDGQPGGEGTATDIKLSDPS